jgi:hypothetical protein
VLHVVVEAPDVPVLCHLTTAPLEIWNEKYWQPHGMSAEPAADKREAFHSRSPSVLAVEKSVKSPASTASFRAEGFQGLQISTKTLGICMCIHEQHPFNLVSQRPLL